MSSTNLNPQTTQISLIEAGSLVCLVHQLDGMTNAQRHTGERGARADMHLAAWIASREYAGTGFPNVGQLFV